MSFDLRIELVGLCLFVPDPGTGTLYVLMPAAGGHGHGVDPHVVRLCFDSAHLQPGSPRPNGIPALVAMDRVELVAAAAGGELSLALPDELVDVGTETRRRIFPGALRGDDPARRLAARVELRTGACTNYQPGVCWSFPTPLRQQRLCNRLIWNVGQIEEERLELAFDPLAGGKGATLPPLYPIDGGIELSVYHTTRDELPPAPHDPSPPPWGAPAHHFGAFYALFDPPVTDGPLPLFVGVACGKHIGDGGSPYTCMAAQSPPDPPPLVRRRR
jgi:hypothetical protein